MPAEPRQAVFRSDVTAELIKHAAADVIWAARVSTAGEQSLDEIEADPGRSAGLIKLSDAGSPRHSVRAFFDDLLCAGPDLVLREFMRHRTFSFNEESGRYRELAGRPLRHELVVSATQRACREAYLAYRDMLAAGIAREVARAVLPVGLYSSMYATCNARALMNFLALRVRSDRSAFPSYPQREIEMVAQQMEAQWAQLMPITHDAFERNGRVCP